MTYEPDWYDTHCPTCNALEPDHTPTCAVVFRARGVDSYVEMSEDAVEVRERQANRKRLMDRGRGVEKIIQAMSGEDSDA